MPSALPTAPLPPPSPGDASAAFLANVSHELRTPVHLIVNYAELVREELQDRELFALADDVDRIGAQGRRLAALIADVLEVAALQAGVARIARDPVDLPNLLAEVVERSQPAARQGRNRIAVRGAATVGPFRGDAARLARVVAELVQAACRGTHDGLVQVDCRREGATLVCVVRDDGAPAAAGQQMVLFEALRLGAAAAGDPDGMGLAIAQSLATLMEGEITVRSSWGPWTELTLRVPIC